MKVLRALTAILVLTLLLCILTGTAVAGTPPPVPQKPTPTPAPPSGGGGGGSAPPSYSAPSFQPSTVDLRSSDGTVIGTMTGVDYFTIRLSASASGTVEGQSHSVALAADMSSQPAGATLDIKLGPEGSLPEGMDNVVTLSSATVKADSRNGWPLKTGVTVKFTVPAARLATPDAKCYLVYQDSAGHHVITASVTRDSDVATIEAVAPGIAGTFTVVAAGGPRPTPAATPDPEPTAAPTPAPTPKPAQTGFAGWWSSLWVSTFGTFAIGEAAGAVILILAGRLWK